jgi:hypothetical protein
MLASLSAGAYLEGLPVGFNVGVLVGPGVVLRSCGRPSSDGPLACPGDRRPLRVLLILILIILAREIVFGREGELLPGDELSSSTVSTTIVGRGRGGRRSCSPEGPWWAGGIRRSWPCRR